ncbi:hypothetical protein NS303_12340 [Pantoea ananatis]|nr:hypothetical protein KR94_14070 [Pantoea ananatis]KTR48042.1 hypothetical protein NS303_12340 [Pantoea ananatis]KTR52418.1 hypothetical protein NS311_20300 [Pantoea ananatis]KTR63016.1 hypothetical protein RSA47_19230 [Pantoea ananatis]KTR68033.1 hypothetical protein NS296_20235 [Pantoea ananatis]
MADFRVLTLSHYVFQQQKRNFRSHLPHTDIPVNTLCTSIKMRAELKPLMHELIMLATKQGK